MNNLECSSELNRQINSETVIEDCIMDEINLDISSLSLSFLFQKFI